MKDLIDRKAVIDAIEFGITYARAINKETGEVKELFREGNDELKKAVERVKELPSAQPDVPDTNVGDIISKQAVKHLDLFTKTYCRDKSVKDDLVFRCNQCDFQLPDGTCLVKTMARKLCPDYREFGSMGDL